MITPRLYQQTIFASTTKTNTLVVLPTGLGKTLIAKMLCKHRYDKFKDKKILIMAPTKPLIEQHISSFKDIFSEEDMFLSTGTIKPDKRQENYNNKKIIFATPQTIENDLINKRLDLNNFSLIVFDEAHKATGDYAYTFVAKQYYENQSYDDFISNEPNDSKRILALTASPGTNKDKIREVCNNVYATKIEVKKQEDEDVKSYVQKVNVDYIEVDLPDFFTVIKKDLENAFKERTELLKQLDCFQGKLSNQINKRDLLKLQGSLVAEISKGSDTDSNVYTSISLCAQCIKISHAKELLETQGISACKESLDKMFDEVHKKKTKALQNLTNDIHIIRARNNTNLAYNKNLEHPKLDKLKEIVESEIRKKKDTKIIVFNQYRDSINRVVKELNKVSRVSAKAFVGQAKSKNLGMSQKEQKQAIDDFSAGLFNVIAMTSVGEEGLDIPSVDLVIFYEPVPSGIRTIQRRGRTGRHSTGNIKTLVAKNTVDVAYRWAAHHKEKNMYKVLDKITKDVQNELDKKKKELDIKTNNMTINQFTKKEVPTNNKNGNKIKIVCDQRENGNIIKEMFSMGIDCEVKNIGCDFYLSERCGVERKKVKDFVDSIVDGRLLLQIKDLAQNFSRPILLLEGEENIYAVRNIHPNAIRAMISTITVSYRIPIIFTKTETESAQILKTIAGKEQSESKNSNFNIHFEKQNLSKNEELEYIVSAIPGIGTKTSKTLLEELGSIKNIFTATKNQITSIKGIGPKVAESINELLNREYKKEK